MVFQQKTQSLVPWTVVLGTCSVKSTRCAVQVVLPPDFLEPDCSAKVPRLAAAAAASGNLRHLRWFSSDLVAGI